MRNGWRRPSSGRRPRRTGATRGRRGARSRAQPRGERRAAAGPHVASEILSYARRENITLILVGRSRRSGLRRSGRGTLSEALLRRAELIDVQVVTGEGADDATGGRRSALGGAARAGGVRGAGRHGRRSGRAWRDADDRVPLPNMSMIFLAAVIVCAACVSASNRRSRGRPVLSRLRLLLHSAALRVHHRRAAGILRARSIFLSSPLVVGWLAGRARDQERLASEAAQATRSLVEFSRSLSGAVALGDILKPRPYMRRRRSARNAS